MQQMALISRVDSLRSLKSDSEMWAYTSWIRDTTQAEIVFLHTTLPNWNVEMYNLSLGVYSDHISHMPSKPIKGREPDPQDLM